ncbi:MULTISPECIES: holin [Bacillaceae]|uniref:holin n=1 Tax=Bacillaceae TaxID=186817 RepID=UPI001C876750|nr:MULTISPECIES: holin [Bacillaceae]
MEQVLIFASVLAPIVTGLTEVAKHSFKISKRFISLVSLIIGLLIGLAAFPLTDLDWTLRVWAGGMAGLAATGLYEVGKYRVRHRRR